MRVSKRWLLGLCIATLVAASYAYVVVYQPLWFYRVEGHEHTVSLEQFMRDELDGEWFGADGPVEMLLEFRSRSSYCGILAFEEATVYDVAIDGVGLLTATLALTEIESGETTYVRATLDKDLFVLTARVPVTGSPSIELFRVPGGQATEGVVHLRRIIARARSG